MKLCYKTRHFSRSKKRVVSDINITPFVDIVLVLLIIFMITAPMLNNGFDVNLPKVTSNQISVNKSEQIIFSVDKLNQIRINNKLYSVSEVKDYLQKYDPSSTQVFIKGDEGADYGAVIELMSVINQNGFINISLVIDLLVNNV